MENSIKIIANVDQLSSFEMIYIYHHIKEGSQVTLEFANLLLNGSKQYKVTYKNFHLGFVNIDSFF